MAAKTILTITGLPGAGKSMFCEVVQENGWPVFSCGEVVKEETEKRGLSVTAANMAAVSLDIRKREGPAGVSRRLIPKIESSRSQIVAVDGIRSLEEAELFQTHDGQVFIVAVHAAPKIRFNRIMIRGRQDDTRTWEEFRTRDRRELSYGIGNAIALADKLILNEESSEEFRKRASILLRSILNE
jgi:dephospho-CoA kinase